MVTINKIPNIKCKLYSPTSFVGVIKNEYSMLDVLVQIKEQKLEGYYFVFDNKTILINLNGGTEGRIDGFYDIIGKQLRKLI